MPVSNHVKKYRDEKNLTQAALSEAVSVSRQTINAIETGRYEPSLELGLKLAKQFGVSVEQLFVLR